MVFVSLSVFAALYYMTELIPEAGSNSAEPLVVNIQSVCSQNRYLTAKGVESTQGAPMNILPPAFDPPPLSPPATPPPTYQVDLLVFICIGIALLTEKALPDIIPHSYYTKQQFYSHYL